MLGMNWAMSRLHSAIRGRRTSARDEDDLKDPVAALSSSSSSVVRRWRRSAHRPMYLAGCTELGSWSQFMSVFLENIPTHAPTPFRNSRTKDEREGRGRFEGPRCGAFVLVLVLVRRWRRSAHRPMYLAGCTELGSWSQFMSLFGKNCCPCTDCLVAPASLPAGVGPLQRLAGRMPNATQIWSKKLGISGRS